MRIGWITIFLLSTAIAGCDSAKPTQTQSEMAQKQWSQARAGVLATLANDQYRNGNFDKCQATLDEALRLTPDNGNRDLGELILIDEPISLAKICANVVFPRPGGP